MWAFHRAGVSLIQGQVTGAAEATLPIQKDIPLTAFLYWSLSVVTTAWMQGQWEATVEAAGSLWRTVISFSFR